MALTQQPELYRRLASVIAAYDAQGWHRTGSAVDAANAAWLAEQAREVGGVPEVQPFELLRVDPGDSFVELRGARGTRLEGLPAYDGAFTGAGGIEGVAGPLGTAAAIGVATGQALGAPGSVSVAAARRAGMHQGIVAVARGSHPGLAPWNAPSFQTPFGPPVLQVSEVPHWLADAVQRGATARLVVTAGRVPAASANVVVRVAGTRPEPPALVVLTPRSGWWACAAERGGGIACWLELLRCFGSAQPGRDVWFVATSGHELGHLGLDAFLEAHPTLATTATWLHLGSDIGAAVEPGIRLTASDEALGRLAADAFATAGAHPDVARHDVPPPGEARAIYDQGGRFLSLVGTSALFHLESDRWPAAVDVASVARQASALCAIAVTLSQ